MKNLLLEQLSQDDFTRLEPYLKVIPFKQHSILFEAECEIEHVYFPAGGVVSLVVLASRHPRYGRSRLLCVTARRIARAACE
jgi:hypothetical protein